MPDVTGFSVEAVGVANCALTIASSIPERTFSMSKHGKTCPGQRDVSDARF